ncbi:MAG TPA: TAT-variant-translocated molybdopterin oxidoreductase [Bryobacteraceae bacterium]|nr:TAT-variant-translocated molybdopterin oxidoreductase [Bryobacteraceae bacterium]
MSLINITTKTSGPERTKCATGKSYWRSLNQLAGTQEFSEWVHREFPANASEMLDGNSRRTVLKMMAASFGLAGMTACRRPVEHILPYAKGVEDMIPGHPYFYSTVMSLSGGVSGLLVESHDGRPTKIEGNADHPGSLGAATAMQQAAILGLYDPDRSSTVLENGKESDWKKFEAAVKSLSLGDGSGLRFLSEAVTSPTLSALRGDALKKFPKAKWVEYEPISRENEHGGLSMAFGQPLELLPRYDKAKVVVALDCDFLGLDSPTALPTKQFSKGRKFSSEEDFEKANRLYAVESQFSLTGANADHRLRMRSGDVKQFAMDLASALGVPGLNVVAGNDKRAKFLAAVVKDLKAAGAGALVVVGGRQPAMVHALAAAINQVLGSGAVSYVKIDKTDAGLEALKALTTEMASGQVQSLLILGGNPAYTAPADLQFAVALSKVANSIHLGLDDDETAAAAKWHVPEAHFLESWSDARSPDGAVAIQQPLISPLYNGKTAAEIVALLIDAKDKNAYDIVKNYWQGQWPAAKGKENDKEMAWRKALNDGIVASAKPDEAVKVSLDAKKLAGAAGAEAKASATGIEVAFYPSASAWDGRFANNGWMQEAPDPITKLVWGNAAMISPATARDQKLEDGDVIAITRGNYKLEAAVMVQPGHADNAVSISLGYGRARCGQVGKDVGFNANLIRTSDAYWFGDGFALAPTGKRHAHATTQEHGVPGDKNVNAEHMNERPIYRETSIEEYKKQPKVIEEMSEIPELHSIYPEWTYDKGNQWGMAIDLTSCTGCNACVVACQAENNIPVVGRDQVMRGREMHWIRMDRYYTGPEDDPQLVEQPVPCMQCENAPCENVCPVAATTHSPEGLNDMAYNRCVGTRYCANNCPFKVRHFNFLNFHKHDSPEFAMSHNPDVTVRMRGVMEKCTYCVQRIQETKIKAKIDGRRPIKDGEIVTACQQTCPADAIVFGNINDPESRVSKLKKQERNYAMLAELDIKPRTTYLAKLRNPNPELTNG